MKKTRKVLFTMVILVAIVGTALSASALEDRAVEGRFYITTPQCINGERVGYSEANFTGNFYAEDDPRNNAIINATSKGGAVSEYTTTLYVYMYGTGGAYSTTSDAESTSTLHHVVQKHFSRYETSQGLTFHSCTSKSDPNAKWEQIHEYYWNGEEAGWGVERE